MDAKNLIKILDRMYKIFERAMAGFSLDCRKGCSDCCTCNVTATRLETAYFFSRLTRDEAETVRARLGKGLPSKRYRPRLTTNGFASACVLGKEVEKEQNDPDWGRCPLIEDRQCTVYDARPFGCRSMVSEIACTKNGYASMPPLALTISNIFLQYIEHLDASWFSGNFFDMLEFYLDGENKGAAMDDFSGYLSLENIQGYDNTGVFIKHCKIPALMIPPGHRKKMAPILQEITALMPGEALT
ncbi:MAG: hypothetical protein HUN05_09785 [Desulfobacter sp.]|nr:MAG: hypothetical protein HUN05_09785 [Desulfobacter sp.]